MKIRTLLTVAVLGLTSLACGGGAMSGMPNVAVTEPWSSMNLPIDDGSVLMSDANTITVTYTGTTVDAVAGKYEQALKDAGCSEQFRSADGGVVSATYQKDGATIGMGVTEGAGMVTVGITKM